MPVHQQPQGQETQALATHQLQRNAGGVGKALHRYQVTLLRTMSRGLAANSALTSDGSGGGGALPPASLAHLPYT